MFMSLGMMLIGEWTAAAVFWFTLAFLMHYDVDYYNNNQRWNEWELKFANMEKDI